jgi:hypothetical protein
VVVAIMVAIVIAAVAAFARLVQLMAGLLGLTAVFAVLADGFLQVRFRLVDLFFAFLVVAIVVAIKRPRGNGCPGEEK